MTIQLNTFNFATYMTAKGAKDFSQKVVMESSTPNFSKENFPSLTNISTENSKKEYLLWVKKWKVNYEELTQRVRFLKLAIKKSEYEKISQWRKLPSYDTFLYENRVFTPSYISEIRSALDELKTAAQYLLVARKNAKVLSGVQRTK